MKCFGVNFQTHWVLLYLSRRSRCFCRLQCSPCTVGTFGVGDFGTNAGFSSMLSSESDGDTQPFKGWLYKRTDSRRSRNKKGRSWTRRFFVLSPSADTVDPGMLVYYKEEPVASAGATAALFDDKASKGRDSATTFLLLDNPKCVVSINDQGDEVGMFAFEVKHPILGTRVLACASAAERDTWMARITDVCAAQPEDPATTLSPEQQQRRSAIIEQHQVAAAADAAAEDDASRGEDELRGAKGSNQLRVPDVQ